MSNAQRQSDEIEILKSIYLPQEFKQLGSVPNIRVLLNVSIDLPYDCNVRYIESSESHIKYLTVTYLPPITLKVTLPPEYPTRRAPMVFLICPWFTPRNVRQVKNTLINMWLEKKEEILYLWAEYLKNDMLREMNWDTELNLVPLSQLFLRLKRQKGIRLDEMKFKHWGKGKNYWIHPAHLIETYNKERKSEEFFNAYYDCNICFTQKKGAQCSQFKPCDHIFCKDCLNGYFTALINDGRVREMKCPETQCSSEASQTQIRELVSKDLFERYDYLLLSKTLDTMEDVVMCPLPSCGNPVLREKEETLAQCASCRYAFCVYCRRVYHGIEPCRLKDDERRTIVDSYQTANEETKQKLELRYGKKYLNNLVELSLSEDYMSKCGKRCPECNVVIEKSEGCNKIVCTKCNCYFCWLCESVLDRSNPYYHFRDPLSPCNNKLFNFVDEVEEWEDDWEEDPEDSGESDLEALDSDG